MGYYDRKSESILEQQGRVMTITMQDSIFVASSDDLIPAVLYSVPRTDMVTFTTPGPAEVVIRGRYRIPNAVPETYQDEEMRFPVIVE